MTQRPDLEVHDIAAAISFLTRLPVPVDHTRAGARALQAAWAWPLVGALLGAIAGGVGALAMQIISPPLAAGLTLGLLVLATGALHEDGLADCADGLGSGAAKERALEIMKDSRVGAFGAAALIVAIGLRWQALADLGEGELILGAVGAGALSRTAMLLAMWRVPPANTGGLSARAGQPKGRTVLLAAIVAFLAISPLGAPGYLAACLALIAAWIPLRAAQRKLGGQTGDVLGMVQQVTEISMLIALTALL